MTRIETRNNAEVEASSSNSVSSTNSTIDISITPHSQSSTTYENFFGETIRIHTRNNSISFLALFLILLTPTILFLLAAMSSSNGSWCEHSGADGR